MLYFGNKNHKSAILLGLRAIFLSRLPTQPNGEDEEHCRKGRGQSLMNLSISGINNASKISSD